MRNEKKNFYKHTDVNDVYTHEMKDPQETH